MYFCDLCEEKIRDTHKACLFSGGIDIGTCDDCPHLLDLPDVGTAKIIPENEPIPEEEIQLKETVVINEKEVYEDFLVKNPDCLEID